MRASMCRALAACAVGWGFPTVVHMFAHCVLGGGHQTVTQELLARTPHPLE